MTLRIPSRRIAVITAAAAALLVLAGTAVAAYAAGHGDATDASAAAIDHRIECSEIGREYTVWHRRWPELPNLADDDAPLAVQLQIEALIRDARDLDRTTAGFASGPARTLAAQASAYRLLIEDVNLRGMTSLAISQTDYQRITGSWAQTEAAYERYAAARC